jgi:hypothetical protein
VSLIVAATLLAGRAEGLAGARACPNRSVIRPSCESQGVAPSADAGEEVALCVAAQVVGLNIDDAALVNVPGCDVSGCDEVSEPLSGIGVDFVVINRHSEA